MTPKTCSRESGAKLQALGVRVESYFKHRVNDNAVWDIAPEGSDTIFNHIEEIPAYLSGELFDVASEYTSDAHLIAQSNGKWLLAYEPIGKKPQYFYGSNPAEALALWLIWLIKDKRITVEEINKGE